MINKLFTIFVLTIFWAGCWFLWPSNAHAVNESMITAYEYDSLGRISHKHVLYTSEFVRQLYRDFLGREPDQEGFDGWVNGINTGAVSMAKCTEGFLLSPEFKDSISPIARLYFAYFLRIPDYEGLMYWTNRYKTDLNLFEISKRFAESQEFTNIYGNPNNTAFVNLIYQNVLGRTADPSGLAYWTNQLDSGTKTRGEVMVGFSESPEFIEISVNQCYVTMAYVGLLHRAPDQMGYDYWINALDSGTTGLSMLESIRAYPEYTNRF